MASAIPVPGQPGRLFIPGVGVIDQRFRSGRPLAGYETKSISVDEGHMTISDVSTQDLEDYERDNVSGLGAASSAVQELLSNPLDQLRKLTDADLLAMQKAFAARGDATLERRGVITFDQIKSILSKVNDELRRRNLLPTKAAAIVPAPAPAPAPAPVVDAPAEGGLTALFKNPWYWVGVAAVVGAGLWWFMRSRAPVRQVSAVETLGLEGIKSPKRRKSRRKSRKSKKAQE